MHPILTKIRRLALYALAWIPLTAILGYLLVKAIGMPIDNAAALLALLAPVYAAVCLVAWYPCRATPLQTSGITRIAMTHVAASVVVSSAWMFLAIAYASLISLWGPLRGLDRQSGLYPTIFGMGVLIYLLSVALHYVLFAMEQSHEAEQHAYEARVLARDAELRALKAQINPHFLFNSLNSISALTTIDPAKAREMCITLADFLRSTLGLGEKTLVTLEEEFALVRRFLTVEKIRFGLRLHVEEELDTEALTCLVPPLLLQPLVENAIGHGIANLPDGGWIHINAHNGQNTLTIIVENNFDSEHRPRRRQGIGMANVRERLATRYGKDASFVATTEGDRFRVTLSLPAERT